MVRFRLIFNNNPYAGFGDPTSLILESPKFIENNYYLGELIKEKYTKKIKEIDITTLNFLHSSGTETKRKNLYKDKK